MQGSDTTRESRSSDWLLLALLALEAAVRSHDDLLALLNDSAPRAPSKVEPIEAAVTLAWGDGLLAQNGKHLLDLRFTAFDQTRQTFGKTKEFAQSLQT